MQEHDFAPRRYFGIDIREDALGEAKRRLFNIPGVQLDNHMVQSDEDWNVVVCNAAYGFKGQDPFSDFGNLNICYTPEMFVVDFFSPHRPYEPKGDGYVTWPPEVTAKGLMKVTGFRRWIVDHSFMPHAYTIVLIRGEFPWQE